MLRRLHPTQPDSFAFTPANQTWAEAQMTKFPEGRQASAVIPLLWRAQEQEGWVTKPAIEYIAEMLGMAYIRVLEVASFYFMFQLQPVGSVAHVQVCGTTSCMICGAEDLIGVCQDEIAPKAHQISADGKFSWEEVECLGACTNAPMVQIGKDFYEDLTADKFREILAAFGRGEVPTPGPQNGRYAAEPLGGVTSLNEYEAGKPAHNASAALAVDLGDTVKRIDGTEVPLLTPWKGKSKTAAKKVKVKVGAKPKVSEPKPSKNTPIDETGITKQEAQAVEKGRPVSSKKATKVRVATGQKPEALAEARNGQPDDLKLIKGVGPKLEALLHKLGFFHFDQVAKWKKAEVAWVDQNLEGFKGRVTRDDWVAQAKILASGKETEFSKAAKSRS